VSVVYRGGKPQYFVKKRWFFS